MLSGNNERRIKLISIILFFVLILLTLSIFSNNAEAAGSARIEIELHQKELTANITATDNVTLKFTGTVNCTQIFYLKSLIYLDVDVNEWEYHTNPITMAFDRLQTTQDFEVYITIPAGTSSSIPIQFTVQARSGNRQDLLGNTSANGTINVGQYYNFEINCSDPIQECYPGGEVKFQFTLNNTGNDQDMIRYQFLNEDELNKKELAILLSGHFLIDEGSEQWIGFKVHVPEDIEGQKIPIRIKVYSYYAFVFGIDVEKEYTFYLVIEERFPYSMFVIIGSILLIVIALISFFSITWKRKFNRSIIHSIRNRNKKK